MRDDLRQVYLTAFHEAGHAVVAMAMGAEVRYLTLGPDDAEAPGAAGWAALREQATPLGEPRDWWGSQVITLAGCAAELRFDATAKCNLETSQEPDVVQVRAATAHCPHLREEMWDEARATVATNWAAIEAVAGELIASDGRLEGDQVIAAATAACAPLAQAFRGGP